MVASQPLFFERAAGRREHPGRINARKEVEAELILLASALAISERCRWRRTLAFKRKKAGEAPIGTIAATLVIVRPHLLQARSVACSVSRPSDLEYWANAGVAARLSKRGKAFHDLTTRPKENTVSVP